MAYFGAGSGSSGSGSGGQVSTEIVILSAEYTTSSLPSD